MLATQPSRQGVKGCTSGDGSDLQRGDERVGDRVMLADRRQVGEPHAIRERVLGGPTGFDGQPGLAYSSWPDEGDESRTGQRRGQLDQFEFPPDEGGHHQREAGRRVSERSSWGEHLGPVGTDHAEQSLGADACQLVQAEVDEGDTLARKCTDELHRCC